MSRPQKTSPQSAMAAELLNQFCSAGSMKHILALHRSMCDILNLQPARLPDFYNKLKVKLSNSWKAQAVFKKFDARAAHKHYGDGLACANTRVLIIGAGPCGLRAAIEAQLLGAKVVVIEKRDRMSRNNVLHLWPFVIHDLRNLGAKKFYGKFCAGSIDHISIRQLQCIVLKVALLLGVEFHEGVSFEDLLEPSVAPDGEVLGWRAALSPAEHPVSSYEFDVLIGADGKRNTLRGFARRDFRAKLAIAITANFINRHTEQEARVEEVSGVSFIFKQKFFNDLNAQTGIDLENIVYYKDETHYFVMTAKKQSLLRKGVLIQDHPETSKLLSPENVDRDALQSYAREAAAFTTKNQLPHCDFALNHYGEPDVTLFDFTSMYAAENASMVLERSGRRLLCCLVGDSLLEPFWPTGSGCARGFLSALDAAWAVRVWGQLRTPHPVTVLRERESIYRLLAQTTPENLHRDLGAYTLDPQSRYPNLNRNSVTITRAAKFYNSDDPLPLDAPTTLRKRKYEETTEATLLSWVQRAVGAGSEGAPQETGLRWAVSPPTLAALLRKYRPDLMPPDKSDSHAYFTLVEVFGISAMGSSRNALRGEVSEARMRHFLRAVYFEFKGEVPHVQRELTEVDPSENGNTQEERRRAEINKNTRKKRKSRTAPLERVTRRVGRLALGQFCDQLESRRGRRHGTHEPQKKNSTASLTHVTRHAKAIPKQRLAELETLVTQRRSRSVDRPTASSPRGTRRATAEKQLARKLDTLDMRRRSRSVDLLPVHRHLFGDELEKENITGSSTLVSRHTKAIPEQRLVELEMLVTRHRSHSADRGSTAATLSGVTRRAKATAEERLARKQEMPFTRHRSRSVDQRPTAMYMSRANATPASLGVVTRGMAKMKKLLENQPNIAPPGTVDLDADYGLQQYRAAAPNFGERVRAMERQIFSTEDTRLSGVRTRSGACTGGATIARLAAELSRGEKRAPPPPRSKPGDLMRSIGRIEPSDWNVQRIENKIRENRLGRPQPKQAERVPKWDRQKFVARQQRLATAAAAPSTSEPQGQLEQVVHHIDMRSRDSGRPALGTNKVARLAEGFNKKPTAEVSPLVSVGRPWSAAQAEHVATSTARCVVCDTLVFAAESVVADGLNVHRRCFRCAVCRMALRAGSYVPAGSRLTCLHHSQSALAERARAEVGDPDARDSAQIDLPRSNAQAADLAEFTRDDTSKRPRALLEELPPELMSLEPSLVSERITLESSAHDEMDEDEWADRNFLASETSAAGGASDESSSEDEYTEAEAEVASLDSDSAAGAVGAPIQDDNDNNFVISDSDEEPEPDVVYVTDSDDDEDGYSTESGSSSGGSPELEAAREARRREVPPAGPPLPTDSSEVETEDSKSETESSSATEVSTDSEFEQEESVPAKQPPAITVTGPAACPVRPAPPPPPSPRPQRPPDPTDYPLSRTRSAGGLATKLALELKRRYLLGENEPASVRRSDSASRLDSRIQNFTLNISEFQKLLHPATVEPPTEQTPRRYEPQIDTSTEISKTATCETIREPLPDEKVETPTERQMDTDSLSEDSCSSATKTGPSPPVPRLEVHNASGELVQLDSLIITDTPPIKEEFTTVDAAVEIAKAESESSESCKDATTLALTETELSDWAADGGVLDELGLEDRPECDRRRTSARNPRVLSAPKNIHDVKNINALSAHVCGREEEPVIFSNATDHFEFADEGDDVPICTMPLRNAGYMEFVDEDYRQTEDRSIGFIEHASSRIECPAPLPYIECSPIEPRSPAIVQTEEIVKISPEEAVVSPGGPGSETPTITELSSMLNYNNGHLSLKSSFTNITDMSSWTGGSEDTSSALTPDMSRSVSFSTPLTLLVSGGVPYKHMTEESPPPPPPPPVFVSKQDELKRERQQQTEVVRRLVMERIGGTPARKSSRRARASAPSTTTAPPPPPRPPPPQPTRLVPSMSDPELTRVRRRKGIIQTVSDFFNRRVGARKKHTWEEWECACAGALRQREGEVNARRRAHASAAHLPPHPTHCCPAATSHSIHHKQKLEEGTPPRLPPLPLKTSSE